MSTTSLIGPLLIGAVVNAFVFGICVLQYIEYFASGYKDDWKLVTLLLWVLVIDIFQSGATVAIVWHYVVANFANVAALADSPWMYASLPIFSTLAAVPIQHFMAWRIMRFSKSTWLFVYISMLSLGQGALACASAISGILSPSIASHVKIIPIADGWLGMSVACDTSITILLLWYLNKSRTGFKRTDSIIYRLCRVTVEAALPVSLLCILDLVFLTTNPFNNLHFMCAMPVGRLYTNTLLTTLNAREGLRRTMESSVHNSIQLGSRIAHGNRTTEVHVNVEQEVQLDQLKSGNQLASDASGEETFYTETTPSSERKANFA
ncbi:hypothetical protein M0805_007324 [Coniferiporia weirii]|nr:hypothetical protein M0805_007324 [Coniferiporia weirii]